MKTWTRALGWLIALLVVAGLLWLAFRPQPVAVDVGPVTRGRLEVTLDNDGRTRVRDIYVVRAPLPGTLARIDLEAGDAVEAGKTVLAVLEPALPSLLDERSVMEASARVRAAEAGLDRAQKLEREAEAQLAFARSQLGRLRGLAAQDLRSTQDLEDAEREVNVRIEQLAAADAGVAVAQFELELARAALLRTRPQNGDPSPEERRLTVVSPIVGRVFRVHRESAGPVQLGDPLLEIGDPGRLEVVADYLSTDAVRIQAGQSAVLYGWGGERELAARVRLVEPSGFTKLSALGVEEQRVNVILDLDDTTEARALGDGFRVEVRVIVWRADDALRVPASSLFPQREGWAVFRVEGDRAKRQSVRIGRRSALEAEVLGGLAEGQEVVLFPGDTVEDDVLLAPRR